MKTALVLPPKQKLAQDQYHSIPQKGIGYVAGCLKKNKFQFDLYNSKFNNLYEKDLLDILLKENYNIIAFSAMTIEIKSVHRIASKIKEINKNTLVIIGGCHINALPQSTMEEFTSFDLGCIGEHEDQMHLIIEALYSKDFNQLSAFDNIIFRKKNELYYKNLERRFITDINTIPWPVNELFGKENIMPTYLTARGCPFNCCFCQHNSGRKVRKRDVADICDEIEFYTNYFHQKTFSFADETFITDKNFTKEICAELIKRNLQSKLKWMCETHVNTADLELFQIMKEAGCYHVTYGVESGSNRILKKIEKSSSREAIVKAVELARSAKLDVGTLFILGHPEETKQTMIETISLGVHLKPEFLTFSIMTPYPGTKIFEYAQNNQFGLHLLTLDWELYDNVTSNAMKWDNYSVVTIKIFQACGLVVHHLYRLKVGDLFHYVLKHRKGIIAYFLSFLRFRRKEKSNSILS
jgi:anaerobic magnesium-protoporphyrin IX monomethyl ester cyclase